MQKGKFSAGAEALVSTLKNVDFLRRRKRGEAAIHTGVHVC